MAEGKGKAAGSALEWIAALVGAVVTLSLLAVIGWEAATGQRDLPPSFEVRVERIVKDPSGGFVVELVAENSGDMTAAAVGIEGVLKQGGAEIERSRATIDYLPAGGKRRGGLVFSHDPRRHQIELRATGYQDP